MAIQMKMILLSLVMLLIGFEPAFSGKLLKKLNKELKKKGFKTFNQMQSKIGRNTMDIGSNTVDIGSNATWTLAHIGKNTNDIKSVVGAVSNNTDKIATNSKIIEEHLQGTDDCFVEDMLFVVNSTTPTATATACKHKCEEDPNNCTFWTWNTWSKRCGIHYYEVNTTVSAQTQITGRKGKDEELMNQVYVSVAIKIAPTNSYHYQKQICSLACNLYPYSLKCITFTVFGPNFEGEGNNTCVLNYGPANYRMLEIPGKTGFGSAPKQCF